MREVRRSSLLPFTPAQMYDLVADIQRYPEFLPWCSSAEILAADGEYVTARIGMSLGLVRASFTTRNRLLPGTGMEMRLVDGPFRSLEGRWEFSAIGESGTRALLELAFETSGPIGGIFFGPAFEQVCNQLVDSFGRRARQVYGAR